MTYTSDDIEKGYCQIDGGPVYECYFPKERQYWNGWAVPAGLTAKSLCDFIDESMRCYSPTDNPEDHIARDEWCVDLLTSIRTHQYGEWGEPASLTIYSVGDGLIWDEVNQSGEQL